MAKVGILRFPGTNCDRDTWQAIEESGGQPQWLWHKDRFDVKDYESFIVPGGFSYGDYLRSGALAAHSPVMSSLKEAAEKGAPIFGICNGFQVMTQLGLVPALDGKFGEQQAGLMRNESTKYQCEWVDVKNISQKCVWTKGIEKMPIPIAHGEGNFYIDDEKLAQLKANDQVVFEYDGKNPNGSIANIAGICDPSGRIFGLMPHPERFLFATNHPQWTKQAEVARRNDLAFDPMGLGQKIFDNAVQYFL